MHIALAISQKISPSFGAVAFDFEKVLEPHEHLQRDMLICTGTLMLEADRLADWIKRNIGKRAFVWADDPLVTLDTVSEFFDDPKPWGYRQWADTHTLTWAAQHVLGSEFHVPSIALTGLQGGPPLHQAAMSATLIQAALRALTLHERRYGPGKVTYPRE